MSSASVRRLTPQEYLAQERLAEHRSEFFRGEVFAMAGTSFRHSLIKDNVSRETGNQLKDGPCRVVTSDQRVKVRDTGLYTYPDVVIICEEPQFEDKMLDTLLNPLVLVEVLSDSTEKYDRGTKFEHYRKLASLQEYILISQVRPLVEHYVRQPDGSWPVTVYDDLSQVFEFASIPARIPLEEIYRGVQFSESRPGPPEPSPSGEPG
jgi:Uma2 family endonuclease